MPIYEYVCQSCNHELEELQKMMDPPLTHCPQCDKDELARQLSASAFHLKGGGWYKDGYSSSQSSDDKNKKDKSTTSPDTSKSSTETKSESSKPSSKSKPESTTSSAKSNAA